MSPQRPAVARRGRPRRVGRRSPSFTAIISDIHLSDVEAPEPSIPLWRRHKHADQLPDGRLVALLAHLRVLSGGAPVELVLNGDVFDFDAVKAVPEAAPWPVSALERLRGLYPEEPKSVWKLERIIAHHPALFEALRAWLAEGNTLLFVIGNHDVELHWPGCQAVLRAALPAEPDALTLCEFYAISHHDTLITHGNQFDPYCVVHDPLHPFIEVDGRARVRLPFGDQAARLMMNGLGLYNPHVDDTVRRPVVDHLVHYVRVVAWHQPFVAWTWFWSSFATMWVSVGEGFRPAIRDPRDLAAREADVSRRSRASSTVTRGLAAMAVHPAVFEPVKVARELWLDRAFLLGALIFATVQVFSALRLISGAGATGAFVAFILLLVPFVRYARSCRSSIGEAEVNIRESLTTLAQIARVRRVVMGHTHRARRESVDGVEYLNTGHWSPAFFDAECTMPLGRNAFAWLVPTPDGPRAAELRVFAQGVSTVMAPAEVTAVLDAPPPWAPGGMPELNA